LKAYTLKETAMQLKAADFNYVRDVYRRLMVMGADPNVQNLGQLPDNFFRTREVLKGIQQSLLGET